MSKADLLGKSSEFDRARAARSSPRRQVINATVGGDPTELPIEAISHNPDNPRENIGDVTGLADTLREIGLVNPITVASVAAYTRDRPDRAAELEPAAEYVVVDGHRRLAAARHAGLPTVKVHVDDALVSSDEGLLEAAFVANAQRENMSELDEAQALEKLVKFYGSQGKAAKRLGVTQAYISQRLSLLALTPELQADLESGTRKVEHVRGLAKLPPQEQKARADERAEQARLAAEERQRKKGQRKQHHMPAPTEGQPAHNAVMTSLAPTAGTTTHNGVMTGRTPTAPEPATVLPHQDAPQEDEEPEPPQRMPWHDDAQVMDIILRKMTAEAFDKLLSRFLAIAREREQQGADRP